MKQLLLTITLSLTIVFTNAQAIEDIDINNVRASVMNIGTIFNNFTNARFVVPKTLPGQLEKSTIFGAGPWIGGLYNAQLYLAAETYRQNGMDLQFGPISIDTSQSYQNNWNRLWKINKVVLDTFILRVQNGADVSSAVFADIIDWPARGNVYGADIQHNDYAPFVDANNNNYYDPLAGDYPIIKGDLCIYTIMNDNIPHTESQGQIMKVDIHRMVYAYATNNEVNNTVFVDYKIVNKSERQYDQFIFSSWVDFDLGNYLDDYIGSDTLRNMVYAYNGDNNDEGVLGYGLNPPAQACVFINQKMHTSMYYNNNFNLKIGNPTTAAHYYNYMKGRWKDGSRMTASDTGYNTGAPITNYAFAGNPCHNNGWWEGSAGIVPGDRRILASTEPITLYNEEEFNISLAFVFARTTANNIAVVCDLKTAVDGVVNWYSQNVSTGIAQTSQELNVSVYPNPAKRAIHVQGIDHAMVSFFDITGKLRKTHALSNQDVINVQDLSPGLYLIKISTSTGSVTKRLMIE